MIIDDSITLESVCSNELNMFEFTTQHGLMRNVSKFVGIDYVIALTSYPKRIHHTYKTILSLLNQGTNFKIILCLSKEEFPTLDFVPSNLRELSYACNFSIIFCEKNIKLFKKTLFARKMFPKLPILSVDDDWWYRGDFCDIMWSMYSAFENNPRIISWNYNQFICNDIHWCSGAGYGVFYPPSIDFTNMYETLLSNEIIETSLDDEYNAFIAKKLGIKYYYVFPSDTYEPGERIPNTLECHDAVYWINRMYSDRERIFKLCDEQYRTYYGK